MSESNKVVFMYLDAVKFVVDKSDKAKLVSSCLYTQDQIQSNLL